MSTLVSLKCLTKPAVTLSVTQKFDRYATAHPALDSLASSLRESTPAASNGGLLNVVNDLRLSCRISDSADAALVRLYGSDDFRDQIRALRLLNDDFSRTRDSLDGFFGSLFLGDNLPKVRAHFVKSGSLALLQVALAHDLLGSSTEVSLSLGAQRTFQASCQIIFGN